MGTIQTSIAEAAYTRLGDYRIVRLLGEGGMALVWLGEDLRSSKEVAIKVPRLQISNADEQLKREAYLLAALEHPHIIRMRHYGTHNDQPFLVMDYAASGDLGQSYGGSRALAPSTIIRFVRQIIAALRYIHAQGLLHCDIKPDNLLLLQPDHLVLADFGISTGKYSAWQKGAGTIRYMAPEQFRGAPCPASDYYALAVVAYEWLCGEPLFSGTPLEIMQQRTCASPLLRRCSTVALLPAMERVLHKALAKDPAERFFDVEEFCAVMEKYSASHHFVSYNLPCTANKLSSSYTTEALFRVK